MKIEEISFYEMANFTPKQLEADKLLDKYKYFLYGGAKGGGKSRWERWELLKLLLKAFNLGFTNVKAGLFCEDYPTLLDRQVNKIEAEFPRWLGRLGGDKINGLAFKLHPEYGGGALLLRNLDDPSKYDSAEFAFIGVDELTKNKEQVFTQLRTILRWPGMDWVKFIAGTNPGGVGHSWVKKHFIDKTYSPNETEKDQFGFLQVKVGDNPYNSPAYIQQLNSIADERLRKAYRDGNWDTFEGQYFGEWDSAVHVIPYFGMPFGRKYLCMDYGWTAPTAVYWACINGDKQRIHYKELYKTKMTPATVAKEIIAMTNCKEEMRDIEGMFCDPSMWTSKAGEDSVANIIKEEFAKANFSVKLIPANNDRIAGALKMREGLKPYIGHNGKMTANMLFTDNCIEAKRTIPNLVFLKRNPEDWDTTGEDHSGDAVKYGLTFDSRSKVTAKELQEANYGSRDLVSAGANW